MLLIPRLNRIGSLGIDCSPDRSLSREHPLAFNHELFLEYRPVARYD